jgi:hypothetical protein
MGDIVVVGQVKGSAVFDSTTLTSNGTAAYDAYWARFAADGSTLCAAIYGDSANQGGDIVAISSSAVGAQKDKVNLAGFATGTIDFGAGISLTSLSSRGFLLQTN